MSKFLKIFAPAAGGAAGVLTMAYVLADQFVVDIPSIAPVLVSQANAASTDTAENEPAATPTPEDGFGLGREALPEEVAAWDVDVRPGGIGLPEGRGDVATGEQVFAEACAVCHGDFAEGVGNWPVLAGGFDTLANKDPVKTVGSYWPYLSTVWDYVHRSMPFGNAQSLSPDEVYAITAYILYSNYLVEDDFELSHENFAGFEMPNADGFIVDDRPETEYTIWRTEPCMEDCKDSVEITMRASVVDVTPEEDGAEEEAAAEPAAEDAADEVEMAAADPEPTEAAAPAADAAAAPDPELVAAGEKVFRKCKACHMVGEGAKNRVGPVLNGVMGATMGGHDDFKYSGVFEEAAAEGRVWDEAAMAEFLAAPKSYMKGTKMSFAGLKKEEDIDAIIAYLKSFGD
ncbi:c-type cytochrome [Roseovarius atlanticus]|uniref:c-type cytochrome n=1 Tax=Roseovarius atlanticus TaxID=1641875 RepID=UPI001C959CF1|nr:c-type cytochrome [Roseovarius atlanticus]MBY5987483.1 c-type cytochrome [Roseovarius atlanticus]MBY6122874.1 c-type cytochrome [Roseovarius atlanticus]MBY6147370.1 c-type cytochrome [Roseovarius atlanticus]